MLALLHKSSTTLLTLSIFLSAPHLISRPTKSKFLSIGKPSSLIASCLAVHVTKWLPILYCTDGSIIQQWNKEMSHIGYEWRAYKYHYKYWTNLVQVKSSPVRRQSIADYIEEIQVILKQTTSFLIHRQTSKGLNIWMNSSRQILLYYWKFKLKNNFVNHLRLIWQHHGKLHNLFWIVARDLRRILIIYAYLSKKFETGKTRSSIYWIFRFHNTLPVRYISLYYIILPTVPERNIGFEQILNNRANDLVI